MRSRLLGPCPTSRAVRWSVMLSLHLEFLFRVRKRPLPSGTSSASQSQIGGFAQGLRRILRSLVLLLIASAAIAAVASASEYGISTYRPGLMDLGAVLLPPPGALMVKNMFMYQAASSRAVTEDGRIEANTRTDTYNDAVFLGYVTPFSLLGARYA